jgi:hypothetical protein
MPLATSAGNAVPGSGVGRKQIHRPELTPLNPIVEQRYPAFAAHIAA